MSNDVMPGGSPGAVRDKGPAPLGVALHGGPLLGIFVTATFLSALLLFLIQPLFAKMVLPLLGGSPSVWAVALCFFQAALLAGYLYAHGLTSRFTVATAGLIHLGVIACAFLFLPISVPSGWEAPSVGNPYLWQLGLFAVAIGLPFVAMSANAPLLQAWFARSGHRHAADPYFMYAASNLGSLLALLGYPLLLEPVFGTKLLSQIWSVGFVLLWLAIGLAYWQVRQNSGVPAAVSTDAGTGASLSVHAPTWLSRAGWVGLAFVPSALLTAVTTHVATDVASAPLLWVLPLSLYLLTYVLVFRQSALIPMPVMRVIHIVLVIAALFELAQDEDENWLVTAAVGIAAFFASAMVAHRTLYESRPSAQYLTEFYLWMATGGVVGGIFAALVAPQIFSEVYEYPILLALTIACRPRAISDLTAAKSEWVAVWIVTVAGLFVLLGLPWLARYFDFFFWGWGPAAALAVIFGIAALAFYNWPARQLAMVGLMCMTTITLPSLVHRGHAERSFYGVYRVMTGDNDRYKLLMHGTTLHGAQRVRDTEGALVLDLTPASYYNPAGPLVSMVKLGIKVASNNGRQARVGVVGLGTGSLACAAKDSRVKFFEIDPLIVKIASRPEDFSFLTYCPPADGVTIGDARLTLSKEPDGIFDLLVIDAFSSDAVPVHLMTKEALELYARKLAPTGILVMHISNRYLDLVSVVSATSKLVPELKGYIMTYNAMVESYDALSTTAATFVKNERLAEFISKLRRTEPIGESEFRGWTDDYSDILRPMMSSLGK